MRPGADAAGGSALPVEGGNVRETARTTVLLTVGVLAAFAPLRADRPSRSRRAAAVLLLLGTALAGCARNNSFPVSEALENEPGVLLLDLVDRARSAAVRLSHTGEHFDGGDATTARLLTGWSGPQRVADEMSVAWATGPAATVQLDVADRTAAGWLHVRCQAVPSDTAATQTMTVAVDDVELGVVELAAHRFDVHSFRLPAGARGTVAVSLAFAYTAPAVTYVPPLGRASTPGRPDVAAACDYLALTSGREPPAPWQTSRVLGEYGPRGEDGLLQPSGSEVAFRLSVPLDGYLEFGIREDAPSVNRESTLRAAVSIRRPGHPEDTFFSEVIPTAAARWRADLSSITGEEVEIVFRIAGGDALRRVAEWLAPRVYGDPGDRDTNTNVVLIVADTLRADYLGSYGGPARTPNLDAFAASGIRFQNAYSNAPMTVPSHSSMFTSLLPTEHGVLNNGYVLGDLHVTLPELLRASYRHTAAFISLGVLRSKFGIAQGFTEYHERFGADWWKTAEEVNAELVPWLEREPRREPFFLWTHFSDPHAPYGAPGREFPTVQIRPGQAEPVATDVGGRDTRFRVDVPADGLKLAFSSPDSRLPGVRILNLRTSDPRITDVCGSRCRESSAGQNTRRYVVELPGSIRLRNATDATITARVAFQASDRPSAEEIRRRYREEVEYLDQQIGVLLSALREASEPENTLIIFTADHGEELFEHGPAGHVPYLYDTVLRVPLFVSWPGRLAAGTVVDDVVSHIDLLPTVLDWLNIPDPVARSGRSLLPLLVPGRDSMAGFADEPVLAETFRPEAPVDLKALIAGRRKLILAPVNNSMQFFDLVRDPAESDDLAVRDQAAARNLAQRLEARLAAARERALPSEWRALTEEDVQRLRALGYLR